VYGCASWENLYQEGVTEDLILLSCAQDTLLITTSENTNVTVDYRFTRSRADFEAYLNPRDEVKYIVAPMKFCGRHDYEWTFSIDLNEEGGAFSHSFKNEFDSGDYSIGIGYVQFVISAKYTDNKNKKHEGRVSNYLRIPAKFER
jgi:hypothetical protein